MVEELILPNSLEAEITLLANMLSDSESVDIVLETIHTSEEFYYMQNRLIFEAMLSLSERGSGINRVNLVDHLSTSGMLEKAGGVEHVLKISDSFISSSNTEDLIKVVHEKYLYRKLYEVAKKAEDAALTANGDIKDVLSRTEEQILDIGENSSRGEPEIIKSILKSTSDELLTRYKLKGEISGVTTGFKDLDNMLSGFQKSDLILLAARPSMGKSAIMLNFALAASKAGKKVAIFSLEMSKEQLGMRIYSQSANVDLSSLLKGDLSAEDWQKLNLATNMVSKDKLFIDDTSGVTLMELRSKLRRLALKHDGLDLVLIDYLQLMEVGSKSENRTQEIGKISRGLKAIAKDMQIPVIALSQLSRAPELRSDHRPILSDLRESGAIEQDADVVMFLYRDEYYNKDSELKGTGEIIIAKHRNGETGTVKLVYRGEQTKFMDMDFKNLQVGEIPPETTGNIPEFN